VGRILLGEERRGFSEGAYDGGHMVVGGEELGENMGSNAACCAAEEDGFERHLGFLE
jgi:hypothetical protein